MRSVKAASLVLDFDLYPRNNIDGHNVRSMMNTMETGIEMPPVIIDQKSKRVVDGFHRVRAVLKLDSDGQITVVEKTYCNDAELFLDAMRYNAAHGVWLNSCDRTRCTHIAEQLSIPLDAVAGALHMPVDKLSGLKQDRTATVASRLCIPLKRTIRHMRSRRLTKAQSETNEKLSGMNQPFYVNQVISLIENKLLDLDDEKLMEWLERLDELLDEVLVKA